MLRNSCVALTLSVFMVAPSAALAQVQTIPLPQPAPAAPAAQAGGAAELDEIEVTGSRIKKTAMEGQAPVFTLSRKEIDQSGLGSIGEVLQELTSGGKALNSKFNSSGNFGYPADGGGIGAGSSQVDLRHLESKRVLVLVDGLRWVNESSASGVGGSVDLNTIPLAIVERIEVLEDGASAIYGSDAIAGVINIITRKRFEGVELNGYYGLYDEGDGETTNLDATWGMSAQDFNLVAGVSWYDQQRVSSADREQSRVPVPGTGNTRGSAGTPQGRFDFCDPNVTPACTAEDYLSLALDDRTGEPVYDPNSPDGPPSTYHAFTTDDRFNFAPYNLLVTPSERVSFFAAGRYEITTGLRAFAKALYNTRESVNQAAPEPIFVGPDAGTNGIADTVTIPADQRYNPFDIDLEPGNFSFIGRRPLEGGPRIFEQKVDTTYVSAGLQGDVELGGRLLNWDLNFVTSSNEAEQTFRNGYNVQRIKTALGDPAVCAATPGCVPLDIFGGQGPDGRGTITQEMLDYIRITTRDASENQINLVSANVTGDIHDLPAGALAFATGIEYRKYEGSFTPDPARVSGESQDSTAVPTSGAYDVAELYGELNVPVIAELQFARRLDLSLALRYSDYSSFGTRLTGKAGFRWEIVDEVMARGTYAQGFRAPFIGELYGLTQFAPTITDPCSNQVAENDDDGDGEIDQDTDVEADCRALGVPNGYEQINPQIITNTGGNPNLEPEKADSYTVGVVYSPDWAGSLFDSRRLDFELTYYSHTIEDAVRPPNAQRRLDDCVASGDPGSAPCRGIGRTQNGQVNRFLTLLANAGEFTTSGWDLKADWQGPSTAWGNLGASLQSTYVSEYKVTDDLGSEDPRTVGVEIDDSAIPRVQANLQVTWSRDGWSAGWTTRYVSRVLESCSDSRDGTANSLTNLGLCSEPDFADNGNSRNELEATFYNDVQVGWDTPFGAGGLHLDAGIQNVLDQDPPECLSCSLNGYDAGTYDAPGQFGYVKAQYRF